MQQAGSCFFSKMVTNCFVNMLVIKGIHHFPQVSLHCAWSLWPNLVFVDFFLFAENKKKGKNVSLPK